jgi:hypothetical protein
MIFDKKTQKLREAIAKNIKIRQELFTQVITVINLQGGGAVLECDTPVYYNHKTKNYDPIGVIIGKVAMKFSTNNLYEIPSEIISLIINKTNYAVCYGNERSKLHDFLNDMQEAHDNAFCVQYVKYDSENKNRIGVFNALMKEIEIKNKSWDVNV